MGLARTKIARGETCRTLGVTMTRHALGSGKSFTLDHAAKKLDLRAGLPGAYLYDQATHALRQARAKGLSLDARLSLAFASSWLVNSPAPSPTLRAMARPPLRPLLLAIGEALSDLPDDLDDASRKELEGAVDALAATFGDKRAQGAEIVSKLFALLVPETVPLLPDPACVFLLAEPPDAPGPRFVAALEVFRAATLALYTDLVELAKGHDEAVLDAAQVLDRLLWFDSEGHRHFPKLGEEG